MGRFREINYEVMNRIIQEKRIKIEKLNTGDRLSNIFARWGVDSVICLSETIMYPGESETRKFGRIGDYLITKSEVDKADSEQAYNSLLLDSFELNSLSNNSAIL